MLAVYTTKEVGSKMFGSKKEGSDTSLKHVLLMSDGGIAYKEIEQGVIIFAMHYNTWYYVYRYRGDVPPRFVDKHTYGTLLIDLRESHVSADSGWFTGEEYQDQLVIMDLRKKVVR
jgi:hypothetical protein